MANVSPNRLTRDLLLVAAVPLLACLLYVASVGPVMAYHYRHADIDTPEPSYFVIYWPLFKVAPHQTMGYVSLCTGDITCSQFVQLF